MSSGATSCGMFETRKCSLVRVYQPSCIPYIGVHYIIGVYVEILDVPHICVLRQFWVHWLVRYTQQILLAHIGRILLSTRYTFTLHVTYFLGIPVSYVYPNYVRVTYFGYTEVAKLPIICKLRQSRVYRAVLYTSQMCSLHILGILIQRQYT